MHQERNRDRGRTFAALLCILVLGAVVAYGLTVSSVFESWETAGTFGDSFGALNSVFSGLAFVAIALSHFLQRKDLGVQRRELGQAAGRHQELMLVHHRQLQAMILETKLESRRARYDWAVERKQMIEASQLEAEIASLESTLEGLLDPSVTESSPP